jgi:hypothetical protein
MAGGCARIAGIEDRRLVSAEPTDQACALPVNKTAAVRLMNAVTSTGSLELCWKSSDGGDYPSEGVFATSGEGCPKGVAYSKYTVAVGIDAGTYDFKLVEAGGPCSRDGVQIGNVVLPEGDSTTLLVYGESLARAKVTALPDSRSTEMGARIRFVNALLGSGNLDAGIADESSLPTTIANLVFGDVAVGQAAAESQGGPLRSDDVDDRGYMLYPGGEASLADLAIAAAKAGTKDAILAVPMELRSGRGYTVFTLGAVGSTSYLPKLWSCEENQSDGPFARCGNPVAVSFEVLNTNLTDLFTPYIAERTAPAVETILAHETDVLCLTETFPPKVYQQLLEGDSEVFHYRRFSDDIPEDRVSGDLTTRDGSIPTYDPVACTKGPTAALASFLQCGAESTDADGEACSRVDGEEHFLDREGAEGEECIMRSCMASGLGLLAATTDTAEYYRCYMCGIAHLSSYESFESSEAQCTSPSDHPDHMAFGGRTGLAVFSRYPLGDPELVLLPSTNWQRGAMRVPVTLPNGAVVDYWCGSIRFPNGEDKLPYAGAYGGGELGLLGTTAEQALQIERLSEVVRQRAKATGTASVVGVTSNSSPEITVDAEITIDPLTPENYQSLVEHLVPLVPADYVPLCTYCSDPELNPLNAANAKGKWWSTHLLSPNLGPENVEKTERTFEERPVVLSDRARTKTPISQHFGLRSVVKITQ